MANIPQMVDLTVVPDVTGFFDAATNTVSYVVRDPASESCAIIDSVMDIDYAAGRITYASADKIVDFVQANQLTVEWLIETHVHADHLSGAPYLQGKLGGRIGIGRNITSYRKPSARCLTRARNFSVTAVSSTSCLMTAIGIRSAR